MKHLEVVFGPYGFIRVHKSYLLNLAELDHADHAYCYLLSDEALPLGISYRQQVRNEKTTAPSSFIRLTDMTRVKRACRQRFSLISGYFKITTYHSNGEVRQG